MGSGRYGEGKKDLSAFFLSFFLMAPQPVLRAAGISSETAKIGYYPSRNFQEG